MPAVAKKNKKLLKSSDEKEEKPKIKKSTVVSSQLQKRIDDGQKTKKGPRKPRIKEQRGIVFLKNIPHGFYEEQMQKYFEQFGKITRLRLARSRRTGNSKGFAYIEFAVPEVAKVAAETMNNYLMFRKIVKATYIPPEEQKFNYFRTTVHQVENDDGKKTFISGKMRKVEKELEHYNNWNNKSFTKRARSNLIKINRMKEKFANTGIDFDKLIVGLESVDKTFEMSKEKSKENASTAPKEKNNKNQLSTAVKVESDEDDDSSESLDSNQNCILLIKKRKRTASKSLKDNSSKKKYSKQIDKKSIKVKRSNSDENSENEKEIKLENLLESPSDDDDVTDNKQKSTRNANAPLNGLDKIIKRKSLTGGIQKVKSKQLKTKKVEKKSGQNNKAKNKLIEESLKELMKNKRSKLQSFKKSKK